MTRLCEDKGDLDLTVLWEGEDAESVAAAALPASDVVEKLAPVLEKGRGREGFGWSACLLEGVSFCGRSYES